MQKGLFNHAGLGNPENHAAHEPHKMSCTLADPSAAAPALTWWRSSDLQVQAQLYPTVSTDVSQEFLPSLLHDTSGNQKCLQSNSLATCHKKGHVKIYMRPKLCQGFTVTGISAESSPATAHIPKISGLKMNFCSSYMPRHMLWSRVMFLNIQNTLLMRNVLPFPHWSPFHCMVLPQKCHASSFPVTLTLNWRSAFRFSI